MSFLSEERFLEYFPQIEMSKEDFTKKFRITYKNNPTLREIFDRHNIENKKSVIKKFDDQRYRDRQKVIDYFYDVIITNRHKYLMKFYQSYFSFANPFDLKWNVNPLTKQSGLDKNTLKEFNHPDLTKDRRQKLLDEWLQRPLETVSVQKNDAMRILIRNLNYLDILHTTKITNTSKCRVSFWQTFINVYNHLSLEDRFFAPSSIGLYLREKQGEQINYNNFFYLFQQYQPKASIFNPFSIYWILEHYFQGESLFTPVLSWNSYLAAFFHSNYKHYVGVDVMASVCKRADFLTEYYNKIKPSLSSKTVDIWCQRSETLLDNPKFMSKYREFFDSVLWCPPYFDMEIYTGIDQSVNLYPNYEQWLEQYFEATVDLCYRVTRPGAIIGIIMNDYYTLDGKFYPLIRDFNQIAVDYFDLLQIVELVNRTSPLRVNKKNRTEKLFLYRRT